MANIGTFDLDIDSIVNETEEESTEIKTCGCPGSCDCENEENDLVDDGHYEGDGHNHPVAGDAVDDDAEVKGCGCVGACEHDADSDDECDGEHDHGHDGHNHDMIDRYIVQLGDGSNELNPLASGYVDFAPTGTVPAIPNDLASGNLGFTLNDTGGAGVGTQARAGFEAAVALWEALLGDNINILLDIGFSALNPGTLAQAGSTKVEVTFSAFKTALTGDSTSTDDATAVANLPAGNSMSFTTQNVNGTTITDNNGSNNNNNLYINSSNAKALGIATDRFGNPINPASDANITFSNLFTWDFDPTDGITAGSQDFVGVAFHEIGHALGFNSGVDFVDFYHGSGPGAPLDLDGFTIFNSLDIFRYSSAGQLNFGYGGTPFFSIDGGTTNLAGFSTGRNQGDGQQASHWKDGAGIGIMDPTANPAGTINNTSNLDLLALDIIGYDRLVDNIVQGTEFGQTNNGTALRDYIDGRAGNDTLNGFAGEDRLLGRTGADTLEGGAGADILDGGEGTDTASYTSSAAGVGVNLLTGSGAGGDADGDQLSSIENLTGSAFNDTLIGTNANNTLLGGDGDDQLFGGNGNDRLLGGDDNDILRGQTGVDNLQGGEGNDDINGGANRDYIYGQNGNDLLNGEAGADFIYGGGGMDEIYGGDNVDYINGNTGIDTIQGDGGNDTIFGGADNDILSGQIGNDRIYGQSDDDTIMGNEGNDYLNGGGGNDTISGNSGSDTIHASAGDDTLHGGTGNDNLHGGSGNDTIYGDDNNDIINGYLGNDIIFGGSGDDSIRGGTGDDDITGGGDSDRFIFDSLWGSDTIQDFEIGVDKLDFRNVSGLTSFNDLILSSTAQGTLVSFGADDVLLMEIALADLDSSDFLV